MASPAKAPAEVRRVRTLWVAHGIAAVTFMGLLISGFVILLEHPRLYWGEAGHFDMPAWLELPLAPNQDHAGWGRSVHMWMAWIAGGNALVYAAWRLGTRRIPSLSGLTWVQRFTCFVVAFGLLPLFILSGLTMSAYPQIASLLGGRQSARTLHFLASMWALKIAAGNVALVWVVALWKKWLPSVKASPRSR